MSDDLIKRLRQHRYNTWNDDLGPEPDKALAADRIEQLENERVVLMTALDKTMSVLDTQTQFLFQARNNLESVQAKLAKAIEALRWAYDTVKEINPSNYDHDDVCDMNYASVEVILGIRAVLTELEKENE